MLVMPQSLAPSLRLTVRNSSSLHSLFPFKIRDSFFLFICSGLTANQFWRQIRAFDYKTMAPTQTIGFVWQLLICRQPQLYFSVFSCLSVCNGFPQSITCVFSTTNKQIAFESDGNTRFMLDRVLIPCTPPYNVCNGCLIHNNFNLEIKLNSYLICQHSCIVSLLLSLELIYNLEIMHYFIR